MKKKFPLVSIIVNCFNGEKFLSQSIKTIFDQTYTNWEIIFWDNKSSDKSREIIKSFKDRRIKYFYSKKYNTLYKSRNLAIKKTKGDYICFLDTDDLWNKKKIKDQLKIMKKKNCDILYSNYLIKNESKKIVRKRVRNSVDKNYSDDTQKLLDDYALYSPNIISSGIRKKAAGYPAFGSNGNFTRNQKNIILAKVDITENDLNLLINILIKTNYNINDTYI